MQHDCNKSILPQILQAILRCRQVSNRLEGLMRKWTHALCLRLSGMTVTKIGLLCVKGLASQFLKLAYSAGFWSGGLCVAAWPCANGA